MSFTFSTLISMIIINAVFVLALKQLIRTSMISYFNIDLFLLASLAVLIRFLLPFEFPFTISVPVKWGTFFLYDLFVMLETNIHGYTVNLFDFFTLVWCIGIPFCFHHAYKRFCISRSYYMALAHAATPDSKAVMILNEIALSHPKSKAVFRVYITKALVTPFVYGVRHPVIILPDAIQSDEELYHILSHETTHYYNHHTLYKILCSALDAIYFWNPLAKVFLKEINRILEISVDAKVIAPLKPEGRLDYSQSLTRMAKTLATGKPASSFIASFTSGTGSKASRSARAGTSEELSSLAQRVELIIDSPEKIRTLTPNGFISALLLVAALTVSLFFVFEPYRVREADAQNTFNSVTRDLFYIANDDGTYSLYLDDRCLTTEKEVSDINIPIYDSFPD